MLLSNLRTHGRRLTAAGVAVLLGTAFLTLVLAVAATFSATLATMAAGTVGDASVVVTSKDARVPASVVEGVRRVPGASPVTARRSDSVVMELAARQAQTNLTTLPVAALVHVESGRLPAADGEVLAVGDLATSRGLHVGDRLRLAGAPGAAPKEATLVGVATVERGALDQPGMPTLLATNATIARVTGDTSVDEVLVGGTTGVDAVRAVPGADRLVVRTGAAEKQARIDSLSSGTVALTSIFAAFAVVALFVSALVIANSFGIVLAQRARELALLRCIGATRRQVRRGVLGEALVVGLVGGVLGVLVGLGLGLVGVRLSQGSALALDSLVVTPAAIVVPVVVGALVTVCAAVLPIRRATLVAPVEALRPAQAPTASASRRRAALGLVVAALGTVVLVLGALGHAVALGILGGIVSFAGVLVLGPVLVPAAVRALGRPMTRLAGVPGELAADNARRTPARAAACASALLVGVTLITLMSVGAASGQRTVEADLDRHMPVDLVAGASRSLTAAELSRLRAVDGVRTVMTVTDLASASVTTGGGTVDNAGAAAVDTAHADAVRDAAVLDGLRPGVAVLSSSLHVADGARLTVATGARQVSVTAHVSRHAPDQVVLTATDAATLTGGRAMAWIRLDDSADVAKAKEALGQALDGAPGAMVEGPALQRQQLQQVTNGMLAVVTGLLAVAVVIALVGIGNTLSLGVLERTRELGLLRALGLTRRETRRAVGLEALAIALVAVVLGVALGIGYGIAAAHSLLGGTGHVLVEVPWLRLAAIAVVALLAGWLASVLPARRAASVAPSVALATE